MGHDTTLRRSQHCQRGPMGAAAAGRGCSAELRAFRNQLASGGADRQAVPNGGSLQWRWPWIATAIGSPVRVGLHLCCATAQRQAARIVDSPQWRSARETRPFPSCQATASVSRYVV